MNIEALRYYRRLRRLGYSHGTARNSMLYVFCVEFEDWAKRMQRYVGIPIYPETMEFGVEESYTIDTEAGAVYAIDQRLRQQRPGYFNSIK